MKKVFCSVCFHEIDTKRDNVGRDNRQVVCSDCTQRLCDGKKDKVLDKAPKGKQ